MDNATVYVLTYESGEYSSWNLQVMGVYLSQSDADADCAAYNARFETGYEVNTFTLLPHRDMATCPHCSHQFTDGTGPVDTTPKWPAWQYLCPSCGGLVRVGEE